MPERKLITKEKYQNKLMAIFSTQEGDLIEKVNRNNDRLNAKEITEEQWLIEDRTLKAEGADIRSTKDLWEQLDSYVINTGDYSPVFADHHKMPVPSFDKAFSEMIGTPSQKGKVNSYEMSERDWITLLRGGGMAVPLQAAVGDMSTGDAVAEATNTSEVVEYLMNPITILDFITVRMINTRQIRMIREDTTKADFGLTAKVATRDCVSTGAFYRFNEELMLDDNRAHFLPYVRTRLPMEFRLQVETWLYRGAGTSNTPLGFTAETGRSTLTDLAHSGASVQKRLEAFEDARVKIFTDAKTRANLFIVHPSHFSEFLTLKNSDNRYLFAINTVKTQSGKQIPTVWGVPIVESFAAEKNKFTAVDMGFVSQYLLKGSTRLREGQIDDDLLKNKWTIIIDSYMNQYTVRPKAVCTWGQATS